MGDETLKESMGQQPLYPHGVPNFSRVGFFLVGMIGPGPTDFTEVVEVAAHTLNRPVHFVDSDGYEKTIIAGAFHPDQRWLAWVESKSKELENFVDVEFRLKAMMEDRLVIDWVVVTYNPYFGCRVGYMAWIDRQVFVIYREKHHTYACILSPEGVVTRVQIADNWLVSTDQIVFVGNKVDIVERVSLPNLEPLEPLSAEKARAANLLPPDFDKINQRNMEPTLDYASKTTGPRLSRLAVGALVLGILCLPIAEALAYVFLAGFQNPNKPESKYIAIVGWFTLCVPQLLLCIVAMIRVQQSNGRLKGWSLALIGLLACIAWILLLLLLSIATA